MKNNLWETMACKSFASVKFDLEPLLLGQVWSHSKGLISPLLLLLLLENVKLIHRKSGLQIFDHSFKVNLGHHTKNRLDLPYYWSLGFQM